MFFPTISFAAFFSTVFFLYWYIFRKERQRKIFLVTASYIFYAFWNWRFCVLIFALTVINYFYGFLLEKERNYAPRKFIVVIITVLNVLYLCFFKYLYSILSFFNQYFPDMYETSSLLVRLRSLSILIPIGVSYYTFKCMSYVFDVYLCKMRHVRSIWDVLLYVSFFPQLASGPIVQAEPFFKDLPRVFNSDADKSSKPIALDKAVLFFISGLFKKMIISNFLTLLVTDKIFSNPSFYNTWELLFGMLCYTVIIYADFSGYSDMAIGIALLLGFKTPANFNRPYVSASVSEFWRRWHISFSSWLRDYLYFGLGGSRFGQVRTIFALFFTMVIAGLWHGGKLTFAVWGVMQGLALVVERIFYVKKCARLLKDTGYKRQSSVKGEQAGRFFLFIRRCAVFAFINISWLIFFSPSLSELKLFFFSLKNVSQPFSIISPFVLAVCAVGLLLQMPDERVRAKAFAVYQRVPLLLKAAFTAVFMVSIYIVSTSGIPSFIYFGF